MLARNFLFSLPTSTNTARGLLTRRAFFTAQSPQTFSLTRTLPHSAELLYKVVSNVNEYHKFIPYCTDSEITARDEKTQQPRKATLKVGWNNFAESFESELTCEEPHLVIAQSNHTMFEVLFTRWKIRPVGKNSCRVALDLKFTFSNPLYNLASASFAPTATKLMIEAFEKRAEYVNQLQKTKDNNSTGA
ncbi:dehydrase and lipid transport-domain-containing protein [Lipomyces japonicus]|uniref:dehydrase and lipid transport-domain-containing protein n=1 Tax=Lipomyces japonicus TaxID=56871 RepID=UPI0034CDF9D2